MTEILKPEGIKAIALKEKTKHLAPDGCHFTGPPQWFVTCSLNLCQAFSNSFQWSTQITKAVSEHPW